MKKIILLIAVFFCCCVISYAQPGQLDPSFGNNGVVSADLGPKVENGTYVKKVLVATDGTMYFLLSKSDIPVNFYEQKQYFISKRHADGSADMSYGLNGYSRPVIFGKDAAIGSDGKIVIIGRANGGYGRLNGFAIARYNTNGSFDSTFSGDGQQADYYGIANSVAIQSDGKIVVAGIYYDGERDFFTVVRYNVDGSLDNTFANGETHGSNPGDDGYDSGALLVAVQSDGKIVVAGYVTGEGPEPIAILRYNSNGEPDNSFSEDGKQITPSPNNNVNGTNEFVNSIAIQGDGKIILGGYINALVRYNADGSLDNSFSDDGMQTTDFSISSVAIQDGKLVVAGSSNENFTVARYNTNGSLDNTFSQDGKQITDFGENDVASSAAIVNNDELVVAGRSGNKYAVARYNISGNLDNSFDTDGKLTGGFTHGLTFYSSTVIQKDGKLLTAGYTLNGSNNDFLISRYNTDGSLDNTFSGDGFQITDFASSDDKANSIALQDDGKIVVAGSSAANYALVRYNTDGSLDNTFSGDGKITVDFKIKSVAIQSDGKIVAGGAALARYNTDGSPDVSFDSDGRAVVPFDFNDIAIQSDGKILGGGSYNRYFSIARFNTNGSPDNSFDEDGIVSTRIIPELDNENFRSEVFSVIIQGDHKIVAVGNFQEDFKILHSYFAIVRYNIDGSIDNSFAKLIGFGFEDLGNYATSVALQNNGKIIVAGYAQDGGEGNNKFALARFNNEGNFDNSFGTGGTQVTLAEGVDNKIQGITIGNNKLYAVGSSTNSGLIARYFLDDENKAPTVSLTIPNNIIKYAAPARIKLNAAVSNVNGTITKVRFYSDSTLIHTEDVFPYGFLWVDVPAGTYHLIAKAFDNSGNVVTSNSIEVSVVEENVPPVVSIVSPVDDTTYTGPATIHLIAKAKDPNDKISKVEFYNGTPLLRTEYYYPYTYNWTNVQPGIYTITAKATDDKGLSATSEPITVTVTASNLPIVRSRSFYADNKSGMSLKLTPNPARHTLQIYTNGLQQNKQTTISVISASGAILKTIRSNTSTNVQLDVSSLVSGVYTVKVISEDKILYKSFVKL